MKHWFVVAALLCFGSPAFAQSLDLAPTPGERAVVLAQADLPALPAAPAPINALPADLAPAAPAAAAAAGIPGWVQLHQFGAGPWHLGFDASRTAGACLERELHDGQWLAGPCRDVFLLAKGTSVAFHLGVAAMSNAEHGNTAFQVRAGFNLGPAARAALSTAADRIPWVERLANVRVPPFLGKIADATTLDFAGGPRPVHDASVIGLWTYGFAAKVDVPVDAVFAWLAAGL